MMFLLRLFFRWFGEFFYIDLVWCLRCFKASVICCICLLFLILLYYLFKFPVPVQPTSNGSPQAKVAREMSWCIAWRPRRILRGRLMPHQFSRPWEGLGILKYDENIWAYGMKEFFFFFAGTMFDTHVCIQVLVGTLAGNGQLFDGNIQWFPTLRCLPKCGGLVGGFVGSFCPCFNWEDCS